jgi:hypothetical protein
MYIVTTVYKLDPFLLNWFKEKIETKYLKKNILRRGI